MCSVPPKVSHFEFSKELNVGDRTSVQCVAGTGDLPLVFTWLKDNVPIKQSGTVGANDNINGDSRYNNDKNNNNRLGNKDGADDNNLIMIRQNDEFTSALSITSIKQSHAGEYTCRVQNDAATIQYSALLKVNGIYKRGTWKNRQIIIFSVLKTFWEVEKSFAAKLKDWQSFWNAVTVCACCDNIFFWRIIFFHYFSYAACCCLLLW